MNSTSPNETRKQTATHPRLHSLHPDLLCSTSLSQSAAHSLGRAPKPVAAARRGDHCLCLTPLPRPPFPQPTLAAPAPRPQHTAHARADPSAQSHLPLCATPYILRTRQPKLAASRRLRGSPRTPLRTAARTPPATSCTSMLRTRAAVSSLLPIPVIGSIARGTQRLNCSMRGSMERALNNSAVECRVLWNQLRNW